MRQEPADGCDDHEDREQAPALVEDELVADVLRRLEADEEHEEAE